MVGESLFIADDHPIMQESLKTFFINDFAVVQCFGNGQELLTAMSHSQPSHLILDINMPVLSGVEILDAIHANQWDTKSIVFSMYNSSSLVKKCQSKGAVGYVLKTSPNHEIKEAMMSKEFYVGEGIQLETNAKDVNNILTPREEEVLKYLVQDFNSKQIAERMFVSEFTITTHRRNIKRKLEVDTTSGLIKYAFENGIAGI